MIRYTLPLWAALPMAAALIVVLTVYLGYRKDAHEIELNREYAHECRRAGGVPVVRGLCVSQGAIIPESDVVPDYRGHDPEDRPPLVGHDSVHGEMRP